MSASSGAKNVFDHDLPGLLTQAFDVNDKDQIKALNILKSHYASKKPDRAAIISLAKVIMTNTDFNQVKFDADSKTDASLKASYTLRITEAKKMGITDPLLILDHCIPLSDVNTRKTFMDILCRDWENHHPTGSTHEFNRRSGCARLITRAMETLPYKKFIDAFNKAQKESKKNQRKLISDDASRYKKYITALDILNHNENKFSLLAEFASCGPSALFTPDAKICVTEKCPVGLAKLFLEYDQHINNKDKTFGADALTSATYARNHALIDWLLYDKHHPGKKINADNKRNALCEAARIRDLDAVTKLTAAGAEITAKTFHVIVAELAKSKTNGTFTTQQLETADNIIVYLIKVAHEQNPIKLRAMTNTPLTTSTSKEAKSAVAIANEHAFKNLATLLDNPGLALFNRETPSKKEEEKTAARTVTTASTSQATAPDALFSGTRNRSITKETLSRSPSTSTATTKKPPSSGAGP
ncbi:hypothetical protein AYO45_06705 [Gammaproteobacteria bacterium SCGC AG-212-F23]|nr:hypothetical protein AYO45_06705 [Gammaproteobacteria bacterium SCGC AG-212-F23]